MARRGRHVPSALSHLPRSRVAPPATQIYGTPALGSPHIVHLLHTQTTEVACIEGIVQFPSPEVDAVSQVYRVPLVLTPQPEGGFTVTSPALPGLVTEGDSLDDALENVEDALRATLELYEDTGRPVPQGLLQDPDAGEIQFDPLLPAR